MKVVGWRQALAQTQHALVRRVRKGPLGLRLRSTATYGSKRHTSASLVLFLVAAYVLNYGHSPLAAEGTAPPTPAIQVPIGLPPIPYPERNPPTPENIALGAKLFSDPLLSKDGTMSCASCHDPKQAFTNPKPPVRPGMTDKRLRRDVPSLLNVAFANPLHHDGGEPSLEVQILAPLFNEAEMANTTFDDLTVRINAVEEYRSAFDEVFSELATIKNLGAALAAYERSLIAETSAYDTSELPDNVKAGLELFDGKAGCAACHAPPRFTANDFLNTGIGFASEIRRAAETPNAPMDRGREEVTHKREDRYKFRTPTLRNIELTAPYMHDGSIKTLEDVIAYYNTGGSVDPEKDPRIKPLGLTDDEQKALVAFLKSLTSSELPSAALKR